MKLYRHFILSLTLGVMIVGVTAPRAHAGQMYKGTFTLPVEAYWANTLLPPGEYTISMDWDYSRTSLVYVHGGNVQAVILTNAVNAANESRHSQLHIETVNGAYVVRQLTAGTLGRTFRFSVPKVVRRQMESASAGRLVDVPVVAGGGF